MRLDRQIDTSSFKRVVDTEPHTGDFFVNDRGQRYTTRENGKAVAFGYRTRFTGAYVCYTCGHLCECEE